MEAQTHKKTKMILEEETFEAFGYHPRDLKLQSNKPVLAACELCGEFKVTSKNTYHYFCHSCSSILTKVLSLERKVTDKQVHIATNEDISEYGYYKQGFNRFGTQKWMLIEKKKADYNANIEINTAQHKKYYEVNKEKISIKAKAYNEINKNDISIKRKAYRKENFEKLRQQSKLFRERNKARLSAEKKAVYALNPEKYIKLTQEYKRHHPELVKAKNRKATRKYKHTAKGRATRDKRDRDLGYIELFPIPDGFIPHHINDLYVIPIPRKVHQELSGYSRETHRNLVMGWLKNNNVEVFNVCHFFL